MPFRADCDHIVSAAIRAVLPDAAVERALDGRVFSPGRLLLVAIGKAAWQMAAAAERMLPERIDGGVVITKHGYAKGPIGRLSIREAGHPVPDGDTFSATREALLLTAGLTREDTVLFLVSGGGSALFEAPLAPPGDLMDVTRRLLRAGADIVEINTIRKRLSGVKGGRFAAHCAPAKVFSIVLSDILGDPVDMIASGPACADRSTCAEALAIAKKYGLALSGQARACLGRETPKTAANAETLVTGSVRALCAAAGEAARERGYTPVLLTSGLNCEAREAGRFLAAVAREHAGEPRPTAFIAGGETVVHVSGTGKGGRNQELVLAAVQAMDGLDHAAIFSVGSDGTDGPTDAAGAYGDGKTAARLREKGISLTDALQNNDAYPALDAAGCLIRTGPTGTNVNDLTVVLTEPARA